MTAFRRETRRSTALDHLRGNLRQPLQRADRWAGWVNPAGFDGYCTSTYQRTWNGSAWANETLISTQCVASLGAGINTWTYVVGGGTSYPNAVLGTSSVVVVNPGGTGGNNRTTGFDLRPYLPDCTGCVELDIEVTYTAGSDLGGAQSAAVAVNAAACSVAPYAETASPPGTGTVGDCSPAGCTGVRVFQRGSGGACDPAAVGATTTTISKTLRFYRDKAVGAYATLVMAVTAGYYGEGLSTCGGSVRLVGVRAPCGVTTATGTFTAALGTGDFNCVQGGSACAAVPSLPCTLPPPRSSLPAWSAGIYVNATDRTYRSRINSTIGGAGNPGVSWHQFLNNSGTACSGAIGTYFSHVLNPGSVYILFDVWGALAAGAWRGSLSLPVDLFYCGSTAAIGVGDLSVGVNGTTHQQVALPTQPYSYTAACADPFTITKTITFLESGTFSIA